MYSCLSCSCCCCFLQENFYSCCCCVWCCCCSCLFHEDLLLLPLPNIFNCCLWLYVVLDLLFLFYCLVVFIYLLLQNNQFLSSLYSNGLNYNPARGSHSTNINYFDDIVCVSVFLKITLQLPPNLLMYISGCRDGFNTSSEYRVIFNKNTNSLFPMPNILRNREKAALL